MNFLPTLAAWQWGVLAAVPIGIILLYFLKLRRQPLRVPSTFLWRRAIEDSRVNSLMQRLRRNLLLFLQLLFLALAILALLRPGWRGDHSGGRRMILLLDASASMSATDVPDAPSRFDHAKQRINDQIDTMRAGDVATLIAFSDRPDILQEFTGDRRRLREAVADAEVSHRPTEIAEALQGALGLASPSQSGGASPTAASPTAASPTAASPTAAPPTGPADAAATATPEDDDAAAPAELWIYSDGGFAPLEKSAIGKLATRYVPIGSPDARNLAIVAFSAERNVEKPEQVQAFARIVNFSDHPVQGTASLTLEGNLIDAAAVDVEAGGETGLSFELDSVEAAELKLTLEVDDDLAVDNVGFAALTPLRAISALLITPGNRSLELALETEQVTELGEVETKPPDYLQTDEYRRRAAQGGDDLIIFDRCAPAEMPAANTFFIGSLPPEGWEAGEMTGPLLPIDIDRTHPIMRFLNLFSLKIVEGRPLVPPRNGAALMTTTVGPAMALAPRGGFQDLVMGFEIISEAAGGGAAFNTDWPVQRSWPVFIYNVMRHLGGAVDATGAPSYPPGKAVNMRVDSQLNKVRLAAPGQPPRTFTADTAGQFLITDTDQFGVYRISASDGARPLSLFTVNLFDHRESDLRPAKAIDLGSGEISGSEVRLAGRSEAWRWLLMAALGMLAVEWLVFNRRIG